MKLEVLKCPDCGANIEFEEGAESCECEYCGAKVTLAPTQGNTKNNSNILNKITPPINTTTSIKKKAKSLDGAAKSFVKKLFNVLFVFNLFFAGFGLIMAISDGDAFSVFIALFFLIYAGMFKVLALTPKVSKHILGKEKGLKPVYFVLICVLLSFLVIMVSPSTSDETTDNTGAGTTVTEQITVSE